MTTKNEKTNENSNPQEKMDPTNIVIEQDTEVTTLLTYKLLSVPPPVVTIFAALQHILISLPSALFMSSAISDVMCIPYNHQARATLFCSTIFMSGICTILQVAVGVRLPILQGPAGSFLAPLLALKTSPDWACSEDQLNPNAAIASNETLNSTTTDSEIYEKLQKVSGALMFSSLLEITMGALGLIGLILRFIGPITVAVTITLIGVSLIKLPIEFARASYPIGITCLILIAIFIMYLQNVQIPIPRCGKARKEKGKTSNFAIFQLIPILTGLLIMWFISWILTIAGVFTNDKSSIEYYARTDAKLDVIDMSPWFEISYPGMLGLPKMSLALAVGFIFSAVASMVESVGDYYAAHNACEVERPPKYAISRGILAEGVGTLISGAVGAGHATTSFSGNIGILILSRNASRVVMYAAGAILILLSLFAKVGAFLTCIPSPILGGISMLMLGTLVSVGLSNLRNVDLTCTRNLLVVGIPLVCGIGIPMSLEKYPGLMDTGIGQVNQLLAIVFGSPMFLGGILAMILDNTVAGTPESRGMALAQQRQFPKDSSAGDNQHVYSWSWYPQMAKRLPFLNYLPFMPPVPRMDTHVMESLDPEKNRVV